MIHSHTYCIFDSSSMSDNDWRYNWCYNQQIVVLIHNKHTNARSIKNTIGVVMSRLVGMGLEGDCRRRREGEGGGGV